MAYTINKYDTTPLTVVQDGTIDPTTDIKLVAKTTQGTVKYKTKILFFL